MFSEICGRKDYYNHEGKGKFMELVKEIGFAEGDIPMVLGDKAKAAECPFIKMDDDFPLKKDFKSTAQRNQAIFQVIQRCYRYGQIYGMLTYHKNVNWQGFFKQEKGKDAVMSRMINALKYYSAIDPLGRDDHYQQFMEFVNETYSGFLQDFSSIFTDYGTPKKLADVQKRKRKQFESMVKSNVTNSLLMWLGKNKGHRFANSAYLKNRSVDKNLVLFHRDLFDAMHSYLVHGYDIGLRIRVQKLTTDPKDLPIIFYFPNKARIPDQSAYSHVKPPMDSKMMKYPDPAFGYVAMVYSNKYRVYVFAKKDCITRS